VYSHQHNSMKRSYAGENVMSQTDSLGSMR
jgi:hypothetical protein